MNRFSHHRGRRGGMVLMEVIMALTLFTVVAFSLVMALDGAMGATKRRNEIANVLRGLSNQLEMLHAGPVTATDKDLPPDGSGIVYHLTIGPETVKDQKGQQVPGIYRVTVTATWKSDGQSEDRSISELLYQP